MNKWLKKFAVFFFLILLFAYSKPLAFSETMSNSLYIITWGNFNMSAGKPDNEAYALSFTAGQIAPGLYTGTNYILRSGFQYIYALIPFAFSIDNTKIDFGSLSPANPVTRTNILSVSNQSAGGYTVTAFENHQLFDPAHGQYIPDTTCDSGSCSEALASAWTSTLTYGFGYRCDIVNLVNYCNTDFSNSDYYKQFADDSKTETHQMVFSSTKTGRNQRAQVTYKVNVSSLQPAGSYSNRITFIATPTF
jgi:hypothetical protein